MNAIGAPAKPTHRAACPKCGRQIVGSSPEAAATFLAAHHLKDHQELFPLGAALRLSRSIGSLVLGLLAVLAGCASPSLPPASPGAVRQSARPLLAPPLLPNGVECCESMVVSNNGNLYVSYTILAGANAPSNYSVAWQSSNDMAAWSGLGPRFGYSTFYYPTNTFSTWFPVTGPQQFYRLALVGNNMTNTVQRP